MSAQSTNTPSVFDLAAYLVQAHQDREYPDREDFDTEMTGMKLNRLVYYCQAYHLVWRGADSPIFSTQIQAWISGPISPELFKALKGKYEVEPEDIAGNPDNLTDDHRQIANRVLYLYGHCCDDEISGIARSEAPWQRAREGIPQNEKGGKEIMHAWIHRYYTLINEGLT